MGYLEVYSILVPVLTIIALLYAGIQDILYREVRREFVWIAMIGVGLILDILYLILYDGSRVFSDILAEMLLNIIVGFVIGIILFYIGAWGGADSKALWSLAILSPLHPFLESNPFGFLSENPILLIDSSVVSLLLNSGLLAIFYPIALLFINAISSTKGSLFEEVRGSQSEKLRCFFFGYKKKVEKINPKKLHYDFMEHLPNKEFKGNFTGDFTGKLDGTFIGLFSGKLSGEFNGTFVCKKLKTLDKPIDAIDTEETILNAQNFVDEIKITKDDDEEELDYVLRKYQENFNLKNKRNKVADSDEIFLSTGSYTSSFEGLFIGMLDGVFDGEFNGTIIGKLEGDFEGNSKSGKITGTKKDVSDKWQLKIRMGLDEDQIMERRQLRTLWQLKVHKKESVWVTPGLPFVMLLLFGYIIYLFFGDIALFLFRL